MLNAYGHETESAYNHVDSSVAFLLTLASDEVGAQLTIAEHERPPGTACAQRQRPAAAAPTVSLRDLGRCRDEPCAEVVVRSER